MGLCSTGLLLPNTGHAKLFQFTTSSPTKKKIMEEAKTLLGLSENVKADRESLSDYFKEHLGIDLNPKRTPWCAAYVDSVLAASGCDPLNSLWARDFYKYGTKTKQPEFGDIVVMTRGKINGHVAFYVQEHPKDRSVITVLNGNAKGKVKFTNYKKSRVIGYRSAV